MDFKKHESLEKTPWLDPGAKPFIEIKNLSKDFDGFVAVDNVSLDIYAGGTFAILGSSGSGKTTLLRMLAGFETPSSGQVIIDGVDMTHVPPYERPVNMMFQSYAVFPHMNVEKNVAYGLKKDGVPAPEIKQRVDEMLELVQLDGLAKRKPHQLSGGQRQRVALARALVKKPKVLLLDEPLAALDKKLREQTQFELMNIQDQTNTGFIVVTHDQEEAMTLSDRIAVMESGKFVQIGTPMEIYEYPVNRFVANFVGTINLFAGVIVDISSDVMSVKCDELKTTLSVNKTDQVARGDHVWVAVRPEKISITTGQPHTRDKTFIKGVVWDQGYYGNLSIYRVKTGSGKIIQVSAQNMERSATRTVEWDEEVTLGWDLNSSVVLKE